MDSKNQIALVAGASSGIGAEIARHLRLKPKLLILDRDWSRIDTSLQSLFKTSFDRVTSFDHMTQETAETYQLTFRDNVWTLIPPDKKWAPLNVDFLSTSWQERVRRTWNSKEILRDALKFKKGERLKIVDATAGLGSDAFMLAQWGHSVLAYEQNPLTFLLLQDALRRWRESGRDLDFELECVSFFEAPPQKADRVYVDPLYPERPKDALNKKELRILHSVSAGQDQADLRAFLKRALLWSPRSVVIKRPQWAAETRWNLQAPTVYRGKSTRFDVYWVR